MTKKEKDQQEAIWELLSTEVTYIQKLSIVKKVNKIYEIVSFSLDFKGIVIFSSIK